MRMTGPHEFICITGWWEYLWLGRARCLLCFYPKAYHPTRWSNRRRPYSDSRRLTYSDAYLADTEDDD